MTKYICIHGHFYQPLREDPWTRSVRDEPSAHPWLNWNEKISDHCYVPNLKAKILNPHGDIYRLVDNYRWINFNFGPTLLSWMESKRPSLYRAIQESDRAAMDHFNGHGSAIAQVYGHVIMPLATLRDKITQVRWGIEDFRKRFKRDPEGMWLPETAVDSETLHVLASEGIKYTILDGHQAFRTANRRQPAPHIAYIYALPHGEEISLFFYDGLMAQSIAFGGALRDGRDLARGLMRACPDDKLESVATDGETFGHHHVYGEMALAACIDEICSSKGARLTVYGEFLDLFPPEQDVEIIEKTSWSCVHGVERWRSDCGCSTGDGVGWNQMWRKPLRDGLNYLESNLSSFFEDQGKKFFRSPWRARDEYIEIMDSLDSKEDIDEFFSEESPANLSKEEVDMGLKLLEMERCSMLMFSSCGWFFDDIFRIEPIQILRHASKALEIAEELGLDGSVRESFLNILEGAKSNRPGAMTGKDIFLNCRTLTVT